MTATDPNSCPNCGSETSEWTPAAEFDGEGTLVANARCNECDATFLDMTPASVREYERIADEEAQP